MNSVFISGNLFKDCNGDLNASKSGKEYISFTLCVNQGKDTQGNDLPPMWVNVTAFGNTAVYFASRAYKGTGVIVEGWLKPSFDKDTQKQRSLSIVAKSLTIMSRKEESKPPVQEANDVPVFIPNTGVNQTYQPAEINIDVADDDLPF